MLDLTWMAWTWQTATFFVVILLLLLLMSLWERDREVLYRVNVLGTRNVVEACRAAAVTSNKVP